MDNPIYTWMDEKEFRMISDVLDYDTVMMEWGSGGSTLAFSSMVSKYYSIEHDEEWYNKIKLELETSYPLNDVDYRFVKQNKEIDTSQSTYEQFKDYIDEVDNFNTKFDVVLIDGRARRLCAKKVIPYLKPSSIVFIHDYVLRTPYWVVEDYFELVDSCTNTAQTIGKFKLRETPLLRSYDLNLGGEERLLNEITEQQARAAKRVEK